MKKRINYGLKYALVWQSYLNDDVLWQEWGNNIFVCRMGMDNNIMSSSHQMYINHWNFTAFAVDNIKPRNKEFLMANLKRSANMHLFQWHASRQSSAKNIRENRKRTGWLEHKHPKVTTDYEPFQNIMTLIVFNISKLCFWLINILLLL